MSMNKTGRASKKIWILGVFAVFVAISMSFVSWLIYAVFEENYREIKQQYYSVVSYQIVENIENSVKNGKQIERFYGMDKVLNEMLELVSTDTIPVQTAITDTSGNILYSSFGMSENKGEYVSLIGSQHIQDNIVFEDVTSSYKIANVDEYELMIQPICNIGNGSDGGQIGSLVLFYRTADISNELVPQKNSSNVATVMCISATVLLLVIYFLFLPASISEENTEETDVQAYARKQKESRYMFVIPVIAIMLGLLVQCVMSYNEYQKRYKDVMFEGATGISEYLGGIVDGLNEKGVPYEKMNGLAEYLADKVSDSPLLWNVSVVNVYADTSDLLTRSSEYNVSLPIGDQDVQNMHINIEISKEYIDSKMMSMLLVFVVSFAVALIMIFELLKLPDAMFDRISKTFRTSRNEQAGIVAPTLRLGSFIAYTGMYVGIPFSSVLILQWNKSVFGLPVSFLASIPMTAELLATMLCSLFCLPIYRRLNLKLVFAVSAGISALANVMCFFANSPEQLIILRFVSGIGFAGIKYSFNSIVSLGSISENNTTENLASMNAGLLGGITCGGTLGAVIAGAISVQMSYAIAGVLIAAFMLIVILLSPWKLFRENAANESNTSEGKKTNIFQFVLKPSVLRYMLLVALPMNFGLMFVVAFFPSFVSSMGLPDVTTSYGYLINGLVGIYVGPVLLKALSGKIGRTPCVLISLMLAAASVFILNINIPVVIVLISVAVLGLFDGFGTPATSDYYVNMPAVKNVGVSQGLSVLSVVGSVVQTFSPVLYSVILASGSVGMNILAAAFTACAVLFLITLRLDKEKSTDREKINS